MTTFRRGQVVVVDAPFSNHSGVKPRPALVVSAEAFHGDLPDVIVCPISSQSRHYRHPGRGDCPLRDWRVVGLHHPSTVRTSKILTVDKRIVRRVLGEGSYRDMARVDAALMQALGFRGTRSGPS